MRGIGKYITYTADDEEPDCNACDYCCGGFECETSCGPEYGWYGYKRTERIEAENVS